MAELLQRRFRKVQVEAKGNEGLAPAAAACAAARPHSGGQAWAVDDLVVDADPGRGKTMKAYVWAYAGGPFDSVPGVIYDFGRCGHWVQWEHADEFNQLVVGFLKK